MCTRHARRCSEVGAALMLIMVSGSLVAAGLETDALRKAGIGGVWSLTALASSSSTGAVFCAKIAAMPSMH